MPPRPPNRDIVSSRRTVAHHSITVERTAKYPVWMTAFDGEDHVGLGFSREDAMWLMAALQVALDGPDPRRPRPSSPPTLTIVKDQASDLPTDAPGRGLGPHSYSDPQPLGGPRSLDPPLGAALQPPEVDPGS